MMEEPIRISMQHWPISTRPVVSICCPTYQHAAYISEAIEGFLMQETTFPVEILIGEDESNDGTREICERYAKEYPASIRLLLGSRKDVLHILGKPTGRRNLMNMLARARGRYIAMCEGDDYWTDPLKLQKQFDRMEREPSCSLCFHRASTIKNGVLQPFPVPSGVDMENVSLDNLLGKYNFVITASVMYRNVLQPLPDMLWKVPFADLAIIALASKVGKLVCLEDDMAVWRQTGTGAWTGLETAEKDKRMLMFYELLRPHLSRGQQGLLAVKRDELFFSIAKARYPARPRRRLLFKHYLVARHYLKAILGSGDRVDTSEVCAYLGRSL